MIPEERRRKIIKLVEEHGGVLSISSLMSLLEVSHMTVRRDVQILEEQKLLVSVTGGVQLSSILSREPTHADKEVMNADKKKKIGIEAAKRIPSNSCIYLDAGTTSLALAQIIAPRSDLVIVTNDFEVLNYLMDRTKSSVIHTGGQVLKDNRSAAGPLATKILSSLAINLAFLSASSWDARGATTPDINKVAVKETVIKASSHRILISDSTKYGQVASFITFPLTAVDEIITDDGLQDNAVRIIQNLGVAVTRV
ncbi:MAG: DeoR/GlpR transcriptional regulator [Succinivibrio sp.]|nr:DeoR/GlpR transcriptional regulator [Succinivibrio sp.]